MGLWGFFVTATWHAQGHGTSVVLLFLSCLSSFSVSLSSPDLAADDKHPHFGFLSASLSMGCLPGAWMGSQCDRKTVVEPYLLVKRLLHHLLPRGVTSQSVHLHSENLT